MPSRSAAKTATELLSEKTQPAIRITKPGIYALDEESYHADPVPGWSLSSSGARELKDQPPAVFYEHRIRPKPRTKALDFGSAAHAWLLEGETWLSKHMVLPEGHNGATTSGKALLNEAFLSGLTPIKLEAFQRIKGMHDALAAHKFALSAFVEGRAETTMVWQDKDTGVWCRSRPDFLPAEGRIFADYKTARSVQTDALSRAIANYGYHMQVDWYQAGVAALGLHDRPVMLLVFQETEPPFVIRPVVIGVTSMEVAEAENNRSLRIFRDCLDTGEWPGYPERIDEIEIPSWELGKTEKRYAEELAEEDRRLVEDRS